MNVVARPDCTIDLFEAAEIDPGRIEADETWHAFKHRNADLLSDSKAILSRYYNPEVLFSTRAQERFILPNRV